MTTDTGDGMEANNNQLVTGKDGHGGEHLDTPLTLSDDEPAHARIPVMPDNCPDSLLSSDATNASTLNSSDSSNLSSNLQDCGSERQEPQMANVLGPNANEEQTTKAYKTTAEYCADLNKWIVKCHHLSWINYYSFMAASQLINFAAVQQQQQRSQPQGQSTANQSNNSRSPTTHTGQQDHVYVTPRIWKRATAEMIDFFILLVLKVMVTYIAVDYFELLDLEKYDLSLLQEGFNAYQLAYDLTSEILVIEIIHRVTVIVYETICLHRGRINNRPGGATPGKAILGLKVISCSQIDDLGDGRIRVTPAADIGLAWSLLRSLIKNLSSVFFIPASFTIFISNHSRTAYDIACNCVVVEEVNDGLNN